MKYLKSILFSSLGGFLYFAVAQVAGAATLSLSPVSGSYNSNDTLTVTVNLDTQGAQVDGVDLRYVNFNSSLLQVNDSDAATSGVQIAPGSLMPNTLANSVDNLNGRITFSQVVTGGQKYQGAGALATISFRAVAGGIASVTFSFTLGNTTDSNVASNGSDVLSSVVNAQYSVSGTPPPPTPPPSPAPSVPGGGASPSPSPTPGTSPSPSPIPPPAPGQPHSDSCLINDSGTFYLVLNSQRRGVTNPGMLFSYGYDFHEAVLAIPEDNNLPQGQLLLPADGALVKKASDPTVFLISEGSKHGFVSASVFGTLGYKFSQVLTITAPELDLMAEGDIISNPAEKHRRGAHILYQGTVYWLDTNTKHAYPSLEVYNSWNLDNDFSRVVPANEADVAFATGDLIAKRPICGQ